jgi:hypothetical protein
MDPQPPSEPPPRSIETSPGAKPLEQEQEQELEEQLHEAQARCKQLQLDLDRLDAQLQLINFGGVQGGVQGGMQSVNESVSINDPGAVQRIKSALGQQVQNGQKTSKTLNNIMQELRENGPFRSLADAQERVDGLGPRRVERFREVGITFPQDPSIQQRSTLQAKYRKAKLHKEDELHKVGIGPWVAQQACHWLKHPHTPEVVFAYKLGLFNGHTQAMVDARPYLRKGEEIDKEAEWNRLKGEQDRKAEMLLGAFDECASAQIVRVLRPHDLKRVGQLTMTHYGAGGEILCTIESTRGQWGAEGGTYRYLESVIRGWGREATNNKWETGEHVSIKRTSARLGSEVGQREVCITLRRESPEQQVLGELTRASKPDDFVSVASNLYTAISRADELLGSDVEAAKTCLQQALCASDSDTLVDTSSTVFQLLDKVRARLTNMSSGTHDFEEWLKQPTIGIRWGVTDSLWRRVMDYMGDFYWEGREGNFDVTFGVLGRPGASQTSLAGVESTGFQLKDASSDADFLVLNTQIESNKEKMTIGDASGCELHDLATMNNARLRAKWAEDCELKHYAKNIHDDSGRNVGKVLEEFRLHGNGRGEGVFTAATEFVTKTLGFVTSEERVALLAWIAKAMPPVSSYYMFTILRSQREQALKTRFERVFDGEVIVGRGKAPAMSIERRGGGRHDVACALDQTTLTRQGGASA